MVAQHYRWDFIGLSTDTKPTPETSEKVVNGSTFYCSDTSKLYVFCDEDWYERKPLGGGGGGGGDYTAGEGINITDDTISVDTTVIQPKLTAGSNIDISDNTISATDTTYTAGTGLSLNGTEFSANTSVLATQTDLSGKQNTLTAGSNITISGDTISATDTTYSAFTGTDGTSAGAAGLVPAPATTDAGKFLKADGTWDTAGGGGPTVVQTTGTSTTDVMSQNAVTSMVYADASTKGKIRLGNSATASGNSSIALGGGSYVSANGVGGIALGESSAAMASGAIALGGRATASTQGEMNIGTSDTNYGYNSSNYRLLTGLYDGQSAHDAATKGQLDSIAIQNAGAPTTATVGTVGQLLEDTTNGKLYICTAVSGSTYTWEEVGAGGGSGITELTSADFNWPTANPDGVATWLLSDGVYYSKATKLYFNTSTSVTGNSSFIKSTTGNGSSLTASFYGNSGGNNVNVYLTNTNGSGAWSNTIASLADIYADPSTKYKVQIGDGSGSSNTNTIAIGTSATSAGVASVAVGSSSIATARGGVAVGVGSSATTQGQFDISTTNSSGNGYSSSNYRLLTGLYDPQSAHDAATKGYVDGLATMGTLSASPTGTTVGVPGRLYTHDSGGGTYEVYLCVHDNGDDTYVWKQVSLI